MYNSSAGIWNYLGNIGDNVNTSIAEISQYSFNKTQYNIANAKPTWSFLDATGKLSVVYYDPVWGQAATSLVNYDSLYNSSREFWYCVPGGMGAGEPGDVLVSGNTASTPNAKTITFINDILAENAVRPIDCLEIDFENWWSTDLAGNKFTEFTYFLKHVGIAMHNNGILLAVDAPAADYVWAQFRYADIDFSYVDYLVIMNYDYQWAVPGNNSPITPLSWITTVKNKVFADVGITNFKRVVWGLPNYSYYKETADTTGATFFIGPCRVTKLEPGFATASRDTSSGELKWTYVKGGKNYTAYLCDQTTNDIKRLHCESLGIKLISMWSANGNEWFPQAEPSSSLYRANLNGTVTVSNTAPSLGDSVVFTFTVNNTNDSAIANKGEITWYPSRSLTNLEYSLDGVTFLPYSTSIKNQLLYNNGSKVYRFRGTYSNNNKKPTYRFLARYGNTPEIVDLSITHQ